MLAFGATGYWLEGGVAAIGGGLSSAYLVRSSFGRIDTDQLNLGLMYLMFGLVMLSARAKTTLFSFIWAVAAGVTANIFMSWYGKAELIWMAIVAYTWLLIVLRKDLKITALCLLSFFALSPVDLPNPFSSAYLNEKIEFIGFLFPNTLETITETARISVTEILISATGSLEMGLVCLSGLALWAIRHPVMAFAYGPLAAFAFVFDLPTGTNAKTMADEKHRAKVLALYIAKPKERKRLYKFSPGYADLDEHQIKDLLKNFNRKRSGDKIFQELVEHYQRLAMEDAFDFSKYFASP